MENVYSKKEYINNINVNEFIKIFILKLERKMNFIYEVSEFINNKTYKLNLTEHSNLKHYVTINTHQNINYLTLEEDYFLENDIITIKESALKKLMYFLISEILEAIYIFENFINDENDVFVKFLKNISFNINSLLVSTNNNKNFYTNIETIKKYRGI